MKNFFSATMVVLVIILSANFCAAYDYNYDPDYVYVTTAHQGSYYFYLPSVNVQEYNPPHYQIAGTFVHVYNIGNGWKERRFAVIKRYNLYTKETFSRDKNGYWRKTEIEPDCTATKVNRSFADALFRAAYGMDFYGY